MLGFKGTPEGLEQGADWLSRFQSIYVSQLNTPGASDIAAQYLSIREKQLAAREPELRHRIDTAQSLDGLSAMVDDAYPLSSDKASPAYSRLQQEEGKRRETFEKQEQAAQNARDAAEAKRQAQMRGESASTSSSRQPAASRTRATTQTESSAGEVTLSTSSFTAHGLGNEKPLSEMYRGDFDKLDFERDDMRFTGLAGGYMDAYWQQCKDFLTQDRVQMMMQVCTGGYSHWVNGYGVQTSPDTCNGWSSKPTGKWADGRLYRATQALEGQMTKKMIGTTLSNVANAKSLGDLFTGPINQAGDVLAIQNDAASVISLNGCTSPGLKRFEANLIEFAQGKQGIQLDGSEKHFTATEGAAPGSVFKDSNYTRLLDDMVSQQSKSWMMNRYMPGSISAVRVVARDGMGRPAKIHANYAYTGMSGRSSGDVTLNFTDGLPECLYFSDLPNNCVTPNRQMITAYGKGEYR